MKKQKTYPRRAWTKQEDEYLIKKFLGQSVATSAKMLKRSVPSVKHRAARLGLNRYIDNLSVKMVAKCFNVDYSVVKRWIDKYNLPVEKSKNSNMRSIDTVEFWKWADNHRDIINWSKYEMGSLAPEPRWIDRARSNYKTTNSRKRITNDEISRVRKMWNQGLTCEDIAEQIGRSVYSVEHILRKMVA